MCSAFVSYSTSRSFEYNYLHGYFQLSQTRSHAKTHRWQILHATNHLTGCDYYCRADSNVIPVNGTYATRTILLNVRKLSRANSR